MFLRWILGHPDLSKEERQVAARFESQLVGQYQRMANTYVSRFKTILNVDNAKELCLFYAANRETRARYSDCIYPAAKRFINQMFEAGAGSPKFSDALFLSGGAGSGKSVFQRFVDVTNRTLVLDGTLSSLRVAREQIGLCIACGKEVIITHIFCPIENAVNAAINRALERGRVISIESLWSTHFYAQYTLLELAIQYHERGQNVRFQILDNSDYKNPIQRDLPFLLKNRYSSLQVAQTLAKNALQNSFLLYEKEHGRRIPSFIEAGFRKKGRSVV